MAIYFQTVASVIPVLLVAGMLNSSLLREYSKRSESSDRLKKRIEGACIGIVAALMGVFISPSVEGLIQKNTSDWRYVAYLPLLAIMVYCSWMLGKVIFFVQEIATIALDKDPHPDRLKSEEQELEQRLASVRSKIRDHSGRESDKGDN